MWTWPFSKGKDARWPQGTTRPEPEGLVQVLMTETMARTFESKCLGHYDGIGLIGPLLFAEDDLPTYIIGQKEDL